MKRCSWQDAISTCRQTDYDEDGYCYYHNKLKQGLLDRYVSLDNEGEY